MIFYPLSTSSSHSVITSCTTQGTLWMIFRIFVEIAVILDTVTTVTTHTYDLVYCFTMLLLLLQCCSILPDTDILSLQL